MMRKMMLQSQSSFNTTQQPNRAGHSRVPDNFDVNDQMYNRDMYSDNSSAIGGNNMNSQLGFLTNQSMYSLGTNPDLDFSQNDVYDDNFAQQKYQLAKDTSWSFAQESFDKSQESSIGGGGHYTYDKGEHEYGAQLPDVSLDQYMEEKANKKYQPGGQEVISSQAKSSLAELREKRSQQLGNPTMNPDTKLDEVFQKYSSKQPSDGSGHQFRVLNRDSNLESSPEPRLSY